MSKPYKLAVESDGDHYPKDVYIIDSDGARVATMEGANENQKFKLAREIAETFNNGRTMQVIECCNCGYRLGVLEKHLEEIRSGAWGGIYCPVPHCRTYLNPKIKIIRDLIAEVDGQIIGPDQIHENPKSSLAIANEISNKHIKTKQTKGK